MTRQPPTPLPYSPRPSPRRQLIKLLILVALLWAAYTFIAPQFRASKPTEAPTVAIRTAVASTQSVPLALHAVGNVVAYESVAVRARLDSQVVAVHFKDGDEVKKGDVLFELDDKSLRAQAAQLEANIARDRAQLENARRQAGRADALAAKGFATKATKDDSTAAVAVAQASLSASQAALDVVRVQLGYTRITAPITGRTGTINVTLGNNVKANDAAQPLVTINQLKPIRVQLSLPQQHFQAVREAMEKGPVSVTVTKQDDAQGTSGAIATGTLDYIDNAIDAATGTFITRAGVANEDEHLLPGMFAAATLTLGGETKALTVPEVAVQHGQNSDFVFVIVGEKALKRDVKVSRLQDGLAVIESGLEAGEQVATDGIMGLRDGAVVKVQSEPTTKATSAATNTIGTTP